MIKNPAARCRILDEAIALIKSGMPADSAWRGTAAKYELNRATLYRWFALVEALPRAQWEQALTPKPKGRRPPADFTPDALEYLLERYQKTRPASLMEAYLDCLEKAKTDGWIIPHFRTVQRRLKVAGIVTRTRYDVTRFNPT